MITNMTLGFLIFGSLFALIVILTRVLKSKDAKFMDSVFYDIEQMNTKFWNTYTHTKENRKRLAKEIKKYLNEINFLNPGMKCLCATEGKDLIIMVTMKSIWCYKFISLVPSE